MAHLTKTAGNAERRAKRTKTTASELRGENKQLEQLVELKTSNHNKSRMKLGRDNLRLGVAAAQPVGNAEGTETVDAGVAALLGLHSSIEVEKATESVQTQTEGCAFGVQKGGGKDLGSEVFQRSGQHGGKFGCDYRWLWYDLMTYMPHTRVPDTIRRFGQSVGMTKAQLKKLVPSARTIANAAVEMMSLSVQE